MVQIPTRRTGLTLRSLADADPATYGCLLRTNTDHLTKFGDYQELVAKPSSEIASDMAATDRALAFGIYEDDELVGSAELVAVDPPRFGLGYLLAKSACGRGIATDAVAALLDHAARKLSGTDVFAGVVHSNTASAEVLRRNGFRENEVFDTYVRYHRTLGPERLQA